MPTEILRPNAPGYQTGCTPYPDTGEANWEDVDEASPDDDSTYVRGNVAGQQLDFYNLENASQQLGTIISVTVHFRAKKVAALSCQAQPRLYLSGSHTQGTLTSVGTSYANYSEVLARPGGGDWSWDDINSLQVGHGLENNGGTIARCTQIYVEIEYLIGYRRKIKTITTNYRNLKVITSRGG